MDGIISYIGVGSNQDDPAAQCRKAVEEMASVTGIRLLRQSSFYRTEPVGVIDQDDFVNAACEIRTTLRPRPLLEALQGIERRMGRRETKRWGPRIIDLDILLYGQDVIEEDGLVIPHPACHTRRFVLAPLCEIASYVIHPAFGVSIRGLLDRLADDKRVDVMVREGEGSDSV